MTRPQHIEIDTPEGLLSVTWPQQQPLYDLDSAYPEPVAYVSAQDPTPLATLNGQEITVDRAKAILRAMRDRAEKN